MIIRHQRQANIAMLLITAILFAGYSPAVIAERPPSIEENSAVKEPEKTSNTSLPSISNSESQSYLQEQIGVSKNTIPLTSRLNKRYSGIQLSLQNNAEHPLELISANVTGGVDGQQGYLTVQKKSGAAIAGLLGGGLLVGLVTFGIGLVIGMVASPIVWGVNRSKNKRALREGLPFTNQVSLGVFNPGESVSLNCLVPIGTQPGITATLKDTKTGEIFTISQ